MIQGEGHRMDGAQRFPHRAVRVLELYFPGRSGKADGGAEPDFLPVPRDPGVFLFFLFAGAPGLHDQEQAVPVPGHADKPVTSDQQAQAGGVAGPEACSIHGDFRRAAGKQRALGQGVPGELHGPADPVRPDYISAVSGFPAALPGLMVELPDAFQRRQGEIIIGIQGLRDPVRPGAGV